MPSIFPTDSKPIWQSKTFWVNSLTLAVTVLTYLSGVLPADAAPWIAGGLSIANVVLRFLTEKPVTLIGD